jgi:hypothetical protein
MIDNGNLANQSGAMIAGERSSCDAVIFYRSSAPERAVFRGVQALRQEALRASRFAQ